MNLSVVECLDWLREETTGAVVDKLDKHFAGQGEVIRLLLFTQRFNSK